VVVVRVPHPLRIVALTTELMLRDTSTSATGRWIRMAARLDHRGWTASGHLAACVVCHQPLVPATSRRHPRYVDPTQRFPGDGPSAWQEQRDHEADRREIIADQREHDADQREHIADQREHVADEREAALDDLAQGLARTPETGTAGPGRPSPAVRPRSPG
jgi:hypothetical protein